MTGVRIDDVVEKKEKKLMNTEKNVQELKKERDQLNALNNKLIERVEVLSNIID